MDSRTSADTLESKSSSRVRQVGNLVNNEDNEVEELKKRLKLAEKKIEELTQSIKK